MEDDIAAIRAFNRFYTTQIGLLDEHIVESPFSLAEARLLYEIDRRGHATGSALADALHLDRAYLSRMIKKFVATGLAALTPSPVDRRANHVALTREGDMAAADLNESTNAQIAGLIAALSEAELNELGAAMKTIRRLLADETLEPGPVVLRPHRIGELGWLIHRQGLLYNQQFGWNGDFEALIARIYNEYHFAPDTPPKALWVVEQDGVVMGSVFCMPSDGIAGSAQLRMLYVEPPARGRGLGRLLVDQCVRFARDSGYERIRLWTHSIQEAARRAYAGAGFEIVESEPHRSFGRDLVSEIWELRFQ